MKKHINIAIILAIFIIPVLLYYSFKSNDEQSASVARGVKPTVIDFSSPMCFECQKLKKVMDQVEPKYESKIIFRKVMINSSKPEEQQLVKKYNVKVVPTLVYLDKNNKVIDKTEGALSKEELERKFNRLINGKSG